MPTPATRVASCSNSTIDQFRHASPRLRDGGADRRHRALRGRPGPHDAASARSPAHARRAPRDGRPDDDRGWHRWAGGAPGVRRRARAGVHLHRPPPVPVVRAGGSDRGVDPVRPRRRCIEHLRRVLARGRRRGVRRERGAALDRRPRRLPGRRGRGVRQRRNGREPVRAAGGPMEVARRRRRRTSTAPAG